jgi:hypothetical protein
MPAERTVMRQVREVLRLKTAGTPALASAREYRSSTVKHEFQPVLRGEERSRCKHRGLKFPHERSRYGKDVRRHECRVRINDGRRQARPSRSATFRSLFVRLGRPARIATAAGSARPANLRCPSWVRLPGRRKGPWPALRFSRHHPCTDRRGSRACVGPPQIG